MSFTLSRPFDFPVERMIAIARLVLATFSLVRLFFDPLPPSRYIPIAEIFALYFAFGLVMAALVARGRFRPSWQIPTLIVDIGVVWLLSVFSARSSNFFILYSFILLAATLRWNWRGALWTTLVLSLLLVGFAVFEYSGNRSPEELVIETGRLTVRGTFLLSVGLILALFGAYRERSSERLAKLASWPSPIADPSKLDSAGALEPLLSHIAEAMRVPRVLVLWEELNAARLHVVSWAGGECHEETPSPSLGEQWMSPELSPTAFASEDVGSRIYFERGQGTQVSPVPLLPRSFMERFAIQSVACAPFLGSICRGRVFMLDRPHWGEDDLKLAEIIASRIGIELEHYALRTELHELAAARERMRVARDLHDGVLQTLTAAGLQLKLISSAAGMAGQQMMDNVRKLLADEQRRIRGFVEQQRVSFDQAEIDLCSETERYARKLGDLWACDIRTTVNPKGAQVPRQLWNQLDFVLAESVANAVRHGRASAVRVQIETFADKLQLVVSDNGRGLENMHGVYQSSELGALALGPASLRERITSLKGSLSLASSPDGVELCVQLPLR